MNKSSLESNEQSAGVMDAPDGRAPIGRADLLALQHGQSVGQTGVAMTAIIKLMLDIGMAMTASIGLTLGKTSPATRRQRGLQELSDG